MGEKTNDNRRAEAAQAMASAARHRYFDRRKYEWQMCLGIWTALASAAAVLLANKVPSLGPIPTLGLPVLVLFVAALQWWWRLKIEKAQLDDQCKAMLWECRSAKCSCWTHPELTRESWPDWSHDSKGRRPCDDDYDNSNMPKRRAWTRYPVLVQNGTTILLGLTFIIALLKNNAAISDKGTDWRSLFFADVGIALMTGIVSGVVASLIVMWFVGRRQERKLTDALSWIAGEYEVISNDRSIDTTNEVLTFSYEGRSKFSVKSRGGVTGDWQEEMCAIENMPWLGIGTFKYPERRSTWGTHLYLFDRLGASIEVYGINRGEEGTEPPFRFKLVKRQQSAVA